MKNLSVHIPTPCHENWHNMAPVDRGRFCQSCAKQVVDFTMMTDTEVLNYFRQNTGNTCGRFMPDQLQRPLQPVKEEKRKAWWIAAMLPLLLVFEKAGAQKKKEPKLVKQVVVPLEMAVTGEASFSSIAGPLKVAIAKHQGNPHFSIKGKVVENRDTLPISFSTIKIKGTDKAVVTGLNGNFEIAGATDKNSVTITVDAVGFMEREVRITFEDTLASDSAANAHEKRLSLVNLALVTTNVNALQKQVPIGLIREGAIENNAQPIEVNTGLAGKVGGYFVCTKPEKADTLPALIRRVFNKQAFTLYPNPAPRGSAIHIDIKNAGNYSIQLFDNNGSLIAAKQFEAIKGAAQATLDIPSTLNAGTYYIQLVDSKKKKQYTDKIVVL